MENDRPSTTLVEPREGLPSSLNRQIEALERRIADPRGVGSKAGAEFTKYAESILKGDGALKAALRDRGTQNFHEKYPDYGRPLRGWGAFPTRNPKTLRLTRT